MKEKERQIEEEKRRLLEKEERLRKEIQERDEKERRMREMEAQLKRQQVWEFIAGVLYMVTTLVRFKEELERVARAREQELENKKLEVAEYERQRREALIRMEEQIRNEQLQQQRQRVGI